MKRSGLTILLAAGLALLSMGPTLAEQGRRKALLTGVAVGAGGVLAVGAGAALLSRPATKQPPAYTGSTRARPTPLKVAARDDEDEDDDEVVCRMVRTRLYKKDGTYVKTEPLRTCR